jgi:23S rRNA pseudouridine2605 synthase
VPEERVQKILAAAGVASRRAAEELIAAGRVTIDGRTAVLGDRADPTRAAIAVDGRVVGAPEAHRHIVLNKPAGVTSTVHDRHAARTVVDLVPPGLGRGARLYPVGRLDADSEGLVLLTNDGEWAQRVLHPRHAVEREYAVGVDRPLTPTAISTLLAGIPLEEGSARAVAVRAATVAETRRLLETLDGTTRAYRELVWYRVTLGQGWKRQVRRMFGAVGEPVRRLVRVRFGNVRLGDLGPGEARPLTADEVARIARPPTDGSARSGGPARTGPRPSTAPRPGRSRGTAAAEGTGPRPPRYPDGRARRDAGRPGGGR